MGAIWDRTPPYLHIKCTLHVCRRVQGSQIFKRNSIILIHSKVMAFLVISLSPCGPHCPHVIPVIPMSSPSSPHHSHHSHIIPIAPRRSPCGPHGLWSPWSPHVVSVVPMSSPSSSCHPHIVSVMSTSSRRSPHHLQSPDTHSTHPHPLGGWGPESVKMQ